MAVVTVGERKGRRSTDEGEDGQKTHHRVFYVQTDDNDDHGDVVLAAADVPQKHDVHPTDFAAVVRKRTPRELQKGHWEVDVEYGPRDPREPPDGEGGKTSLLIRDPQIAVSFQTTMVPVPGEISDDPEYQLGAGNAAQIWATGITNAAGEPFDPPVMRQVSMPIITITRNEVFFSPSSCLKFVDSVNDNDITVADFEIPARCAKMMGITTPGVQWETFEEQQFYFFPVTYTIHVNMETWDVVLLEHGTFYIDASDGDKKKAFLTEEGQPRIGLLTADGDDNTGNDPVFKTLSINKRVEWGELLLPATMQPTLAGGGAPGASQTWDALMDQYGHLLQGGAFGG